MRKKIGIVTIQSMNFGNRLQNYALQEVLEGLGFDVYSIKRYNELLPLKKVLLGRIKVLLQYCTKSKIYNFNAFNRNIKFSKWAVGVNKYESEIVQDFDYFITGSDQVWNPYFKSVGTCDLLCFANNSQRISYAASFGIETFPTDKIEKWGSELNKFKEISVREEEGKAIVERISSKSAQIVLDPTLLLNKEQWKKVEVKPSKMPGKPYCFVYSLKEKNEAFKFKLEELSKRYVIVDILQKNRFGIAPRLGPGEFVYLIHHADCILTDSFHATVFSIIFNKKVFTYARSGMDMSSRIKSLAKLVGLNKNFDNNKTFYIDPEQDSDTIWPNLEKHQNLSKSFLMRALQ